MDPSSTHPSDTEMSDAAAAPPPQPQAGIDNIPATLSHGGRFIQYNIFGNIFEVTAKYKPPIMPIGKGAYGIVWYLITRIDSICLFLYLTSSVLFCLLLIFLFLFLF